MPQKITPGQLPNQFDVKGRGITVSYSTSSIAGKPQLSFKKGRQTLNFSGDEITVEDTQVGTLVSVTIERTVDRGFTTFTMPLPKIELAVGVSKIAFRTIGVTTVHKTSIGGPPKGVQETYRVQELRGSAQHVEFLAAKTTSA